MEIRHGIVEIYPGVEIVKIQSSPETRRRSFRDSGPTIWPQRVKFFFNFERWNFLNFCHLILIFKKTIVQQVIKDYYDFQNREK